MRGARGSTLLLTVLLIAITVALQGCPSLIANVVAPDQSIQQAIDQADPGDTITIMGTHDEDIVIDKDNLTLKGEDGATIDGNVTVKADSDTLKALKITGMLDTPTGSFADLELDGVDLYDRMLNTAVSCTAVVNPDEGLQSVIEALADGDTVCLAPGVSTDGGATAKDLTYIRIGSGKITIRPAASFTYAPENPQSGETITFDASTSVDPAGLKAQAIEQYDWSFGDGDSGSGETVTHSYGDDGNYEVTLTVTDDEGESNSTTKTVQVGSSVSTSVFSDDFEEIAKGVHPGSNGWKTMFSGHDAEVSDTQASSGEKSFRLEGLPSWARIEYVDLPTPLADHLTYIVWVYPTSNERDLNVGFPTNLGGCCAKMPNAVLFNETGEVRFRGPTDNTPQFPNGDVTLMNSYDPNQWYKVQVNLDFTTLEADVFINDVQKGDSIPILPRQYEIKNGFWAGTIVKLNKFGVSTANFSGAGTNTIYIDDVQLIQDPP